MWCWYWNNYYYLLCCWLYSVQRAELLNDLSVTISSFVWFWKFALHINKEIIRLTISYLKASECFLQPLFWPTTFAFVFSLYLFICYLFMSYCAGLTVTDYILLELCVLFPLQFSVLFFIFIVLLLILYLVPLKILDIYEKKWMVDL